MTESPLPALCSWLCSTIIFQRIPNRFQSTALVVKDPPGDFEVPVIERIKMKSDSWVIDIRSSFESSRKYWTCHQWPIIVYLGFFYWDSYISKIDQFSIMTANFNWSRAIAESDADSQWEMALSLRWCCALACMHAASPTVSYCAVVTVSTVRRERQLPLAKRMQGVNREDSVPWGWISIDCGCADEIGCQFDIDSICDCH